MMEVMRRKYSIDEEERYADKNVQRHGCYITHAFLFPIRDSELAGTEPQCLHCFPELGVVMKVMANKMHDEAPKGIVVQMRFLPALRTVVICGMIAAIGANYRFVVVRHIFLIS